VREAAAELMAGLPSVPPTVGASNAAATHHTVIDVRTGDRDGLLYRIAGFLHERGLTVHQAFVATEGRVAHDSFYVVDAHGDQLDDDDAAAVAEALGRWLAE
jgi:[protein-PII] uridylyltransferase